jgi:signal transduction histidine kinase
LAAHDLHRSLALAKDDVKSISRIVKGTIAVGEETSAELSAKLDGRYADSCFEERLAEDILAAAKVLDRAPLELRREPLAVLIQNVVNNLQFEAQRKQLTLQATILPVGGEPSEPRPTPDDELLYLMMDADRMRQVITNLVANAIKYTEKGSRVSVLAERTEDRIIVDVIDEGRGVPEELLEKIFEPYVRASSEDKGQGLGLSIAKTYVELHGGRIWAKRNECTGLTVHLELPAKRGERQ